MSKLLNLLENMCPNGVDYYYLWEITAWDKKFNSVDKVKQKKVVNYKYYLANELQKMVRDNGTVKILTTNRSDIYTDIDLVEDTYSENEIIAIPWGGNPIVQYYNGKFITADNRIAIVLDREKVNTKFLYYCLESQIDLIGSFYRGSGIKHPDMSKVLDLKVPVPPIEVQSEIVRILDNFTLLTAELTAELTARKEQYQYYLTKLLTFDEKGVNLQDKTRQDKDRIVSWYYLKEIGKVCMCKRVLKHETSTCGDVPFYKIGTFGGTPDAYISKKLFDEYSSKYSYPKKGDILISCSGTIGRTVIFDGKPAYFQDSNIVWIDNDEAIVLNKYLYYFYKLNPFLVSTGGTIQRLYNSGIENVYLPIPSIDEQNKIIEILDKFDSYCNDITHGLPAEIELRQQQYEYYRNKLLTFEQLQ